MSTFKCPNGNSHESLPAFGGLADFRLALEAATERSARHHCLSDTLVHQAAPQKSKPMFNVGCAPDFVEKQQFQAR
jgi:hypothetical protein